MNSVRFRAIALDYDETLAREGTADVNALAALRRLKETGRKLILVTGRELNSLRDVFSEFTIFDRMVLENGALLYQPATQHEQLLCEPVPESFVAELQRKKVSPLSVGRCIVASRRQHERLVLDTVDQLRLRLDVISNRDSIMVLPRGINKGSGFSAALAVLALAPASILGIGDGENDYDFLGLCGYQVAVANAISALKQRVNRVTQGSCGDGVAEAVQHILETDAVLVE
jgi:hydroxymethylpyrimidine pyrophosphatase-like HAD family hydrolase